MFPKLSAYLAIIDAQRAFELALETASDPDETQPRRETAQGKAILALGNISQARFAALVARLEDMCYAKHMC